MPYNIKQLGEKSVSIDFFHCRPYIRVYLDLLIATSWGPIFGIWGPPKSWGPRRLPTLPTPKAGPDYTV